MVVEELAVGRLSIELGLVASPLFKGHFRFLVRSRGHTKIVYAIWVSEECSIHRIYLCVFPTRLLPS